MKSNDSTSRGRSKCIRKYKQTCVLLAPTLTRRPKANNLNINGVSLSGNSWDGAMAGTMLELPTPCSLKLYHSSFAPLSSPNFSHVSLQQNQI